MLSAVVVCALKPQHVLPSKWLKTEGASVRARELRITANKHTPSDFVDAGPLKDANILLLRLSIQDILMNTTSKQSEPTPPVLFITYRRLPLGVEALDDESLGHNCRRHPGLRRGIVGIDGREHDAAIRVQLARALQVLLAGSREAGKRKQGSI